LHKVVTTAVENYVTRYNIEVPMSCTGFLVPGMRLTYFLQNIFPLLFQTPAES
jgi:hypothetical protein